MALNGGFFNLSTAGASVIIHSTTSIPVPLPITHFADDREPFTTDDTEIKGEGKGINDDMVIWTRQTTVHFKVSVIANSADDIALMTAYRMNHVDGDAHYTDIFDLSVSFPTNPIPFRYVNGTIQSGPEGPSSSTDGKHQTRTYGFVFQKAQF